MTMGGEGLIIYIITQVVYLEDLLVATIRSASEMATGFCLFNDYVSITIGRGEGAIPDRIILRRARCYDAVPFPICAERPNSPSGRGEPR